MKTAFTLTLILLMNSLFCQHNFPIDTITGKIKYTETINLSDSLDANSLRVTAKDCVTKSYINPPSEFLYEDITAGKVVYKYSEMITFRGLGTDMEAGRVEYTITVLVKQGKYKYEITDFYFINLLNDPAVPFESMFPDFKTNYQKKLIKGYYDQLNEDIQRFIVTLKTNMPLASDNDNW